MILSIKLSILKEGSLGSILDMLRSEEQRPLKWLTIKQSGSQNLFRKERNTQIINMSWGAPWIEASSWEGNDKLLQYSCLKNFMDRGIW